MSRTPVKRTRLERTLIKILIVILIVCILLILFLPAPTITREYAYQVKCRVNMHQLAIALLIYAGEYHNMYPTPEKWCDLLIDKCEAPKESFRCPWDNESKCSYAINPNCEPNSPEDMVLLFESTGGWNQFGGPELLNTQNHDGEGCNVVFNDGTVEFVQADQLGNLEWKVSEVSDNE